MTPSDVKIVADNIDDFIEVPDGINRLRKAVLTLALSGKLVPQDKKEGTADDFLKQIKIKRDANLEGLEQPTAHFEIPPSWRWVRLGTLIDFRIGKTPPRKDPEYWSDGAIPWVSIADLKEGETINSTKESINELALKKVFNGYFAPKGTLLFSFKLTIGKMSILGMDACHNEAIAAFFTHNNTLRDYLFNVLPALNTTARTSNAIKGKTLNSETLGLIEVPVPPLSEQKRIVEKVQSMMRQLDELEAKKNARNEVRTRLTRSAMQALGNGDTKVAFDQLLELTKTPADIKELENALLTLAVSGKLAPSESLDSARRPEKKLLLPANEKVPLQLPVLWSLAQFKDKNLLQIIDGDRGSNYPSKAEFTDKGYCLFLNTSNVRKGEFLFSKCDFITKEKDESLRKGKLAREDVVLTTRGTIGNTAYFSNDIPFDNVRINSGMVILRCDTTKIYPPYLIVFLKSSVFVAQTNQLMSGSAQQQLPIKVLNEIYFPLPPIAEQKRIVKKVEGVMVLINHLKQVLGEK